MHAPPIVLLVISGVKGVGLFPFDGTCGLLLGERDSLRFPVCLLVTVPSVFCASPGMYKVLYTLVTYLAGV